MKLVFISINNVKYELPIGGNLTDVSVENSEAIPFRCKQGICGTCCIKVIDGLENINIQSDAEKAFLSRLGYDSKNIRLACQTKVFGAIEIKICNHYNEG